MTSPKICEMNPRPISVNVIIEDDSGKGRFRLETDPQSNGVPLTQGYVLEFNNNQNNQYSDGFLVSFHLPVTEGSNGDWLFDDPAIWVKRLDQKGACPEKAQDHTEGILTDPTLSNSDRTLTVTNRNATKEYFGFALRFRHATTGNRKLAYDPIGDNQNGTFK